MIRLALRVPAERAELVLAELLELAPGGVEEGELTLADGSRLVEYAVYGAPGELPELPDLQAAAAGVLIEVSTSEVPDDWHERWKQFHRPVLIRTPQTDPAVSELQVDPGESEPQTDPGVHELQTDPGESELQVDPGASGGTCARIRERDIALHVSALHVSALHVSALHVRPPWAPPSGVEGAHEIVIDPGQAFGTGAHATTHMCLELLLGLAAEDPDRGTVIDVGAGSGVLAIAAAQLGYAPVLALDNERESVQAIIANAAVNGVQIDARRFDLRREQLPELGGDRGDGPGGDRGDGPSAIAGHPGAPVVLANLLRPLLLSFAESMRRPPAHLIASGLLREQADDLAQAFARRLNLRERARRERGEWAALWLTREWR